MAFAHLQMLLKLRAAHPALKTGSEQVLFAGRDVLVYTRTLGSEHLCIALNKAQSAQTLDVPLAQTDLAGTSRIQTLVGPGTASSIHAPALHLQLDPRIATVVQLQ